MPKILITGSSGFLGKRILNSLNGNKVVRLGRSDRNEIICDLSLNIPQLPHVDLVIHNAGKAHTVPKNALESQAFFDVNLTGTFNLLKGLEKSGLPKYLVFVSSVSVYGLISGTEIHEDLELNALDAYGKSKIEAELLVKTWCKKNNVTYTILRLPLVVDSNPPGNLGSMIKGIKKGYYFNIGGGGAKKSMVLAIDVAKFILKAAEVGGTYNLTDGFNPTFNELSKHIASQIGKSFVPNLPYFFAKLLAKIGDFLGSSFPINSNKLAKITSPLTFDDTKAREVFGWNPIPVLEGFKLKLNDE